MTLTRPFAILIVSGSALLAGCDGSNPDPLENEEPALPTCAATALCTTIEQTQERVAGNAVEDFTFTCPSARAFLHGWDAIVDRGISVHHRGADRNGITLRVRNAEDGERGFKVFLGCSTQLFTGDSVKTSVSTTPEEANQ